MTQYEKLGRDLIPTIIRREGRIPVTKTLDADSYYLELKKKLAEETQEFIESDEISELGDLADVIFAILKHKNVDMDYFDNLRAEKIKTNGGFEHKVFLEKVI